MFQGIGKVGEFVRHRNLHLMLNHKLATGETVDLNRSKPLAVSYVSSTKSRKTSAADKQRVASIKQKLKNGEKLSASELKFLKDTDSALYHTAKTVQDAREELERDLKRAKTKGEARMAMVRAMSKVSQEAQMSQGTGAGGLVAGDGAGGMAGGMGDMMTAGGGMVAGGGSEAAAVNRSVDTNADETANANANVSTNKSVNGEAPAVGNGSAAGDVKTADIESPWTEKAAAASDRTAKETSGPTKSRGFAGEPDVDDGGPLPPTLLLVMRALQNAWSKYVKSDDFRDLPADEVEEAWQITSGNRHLGRHWRQMAAAIVYHDAAYAVSGNE